MLEYVLNSLPLSIQRLLTSLPDEALRSIEEIRIREGRPLELTMQGRFQYVHEEKGLTQVATSAYVPTRNDCRHLLDVLTNHSIYTLEEELKRGYITIAGGHRVGLSGKAVLEQGKVKHLREITSFNIRLARQMLDVAKPLLPRLYDGTTGTLYHTLIISPPQQGKTTLLRDLARQLSNGAWESTQGVGRVRAMKVGIVDERSEIAACIDGVPSFDVGPRTDVLDSCPKAEGMMMMIRSMSPDVIVVDEIGRPEDAEAIHEALHAGIRVVATAHGHSFEDIYNRPMLRQLMNDQIFLRYIVLGHTYGIGRIYRIYDQAGRMIDSFIARGGKAHA